ncbi:hypothetical protein ACWCQS_40680 [Streptomyces sp. NPDC002076]
MSASLAGSADRRDQPGDRADQLLQPDQPHHQKPAGKTASRWSPTAALDVPRHIVEFLARLPAAHRRGIARRGALAPWARSARRRWPPKLLICTRSWTCAALSSWPRRIGIHVPVRRPKGRSETALDRGIRATNALIRHVMARGERTAGELKERWRTLKHVTLSPSRIGENLTGHRT